MGPQNKPLSATEFASLREVGAGTGTLIRGVSFAPIPEPSALAIFGAGLLGLIGFGLVRKLSGT